MKKEKMADTVLPPLSPTVSNVVEKLSSAGRIPTSSFAVALIELHPEYGGGRAPSLDEKGTPDRRTVNEWMRAIAELYERDRVAMLHGRLVIIGLALLDPLLAPFLFEGGFLLEVEREITEPLDFLLTPNTFVRWKNLLASQEAAETSMLEGKGPAPEELVKLKHKGPTVGKGKVGPVPKQKKVPRRGKKEMPSARGKPRVRPSDNVPAHGDHPAIEDQLGRRAFARALAHRIRYVWKADKWETGKAPESDSFWVFLEGKMVSLARRLRGQHDQQAAPDMLSQSGAFIVHIYGPWGSGKSTVLNFIRDELRFQVGPDRWIAVYFNAWRYQRLGTPWWALTKEVYAQILQQLEEESGEVDRGRATNIRRNEIWWRLFAGWGSYLVAFGLVLWAIGTGRVELVANLGQFATLAGALLAGGRFVLMGSARGAEPCSRSREIQ